MENPHILKFENITKTFPGVIALQDVSFSVEKGMVHAIVGENGAGKSTLMKILLGLYHYDSGRIFYKGKEVFFNSPKDALHSGIAMIHQELSSALDLTVYQNIFLGKEIIHKKTRLLNKKEMRISTKELLESIGVTEIDPNTCMRELSVAQQQMIEIAKAISYNAEVILMDEPTSAITDKDVNLLFSTINSLTNTGKTIIYVSHKLDEIFTIADSISVFRDGMHIETVVTTETNSNHLISLMVGRDIGDLFPKEQVEIKENVKLSVKNLTLNGLFENISFDIREGEILGIAGLMGAGRSEIMETIFGIRKKDAGDIYIDGELVEIKNPSKAISYKMAFLTEDRKSSGCFLPLSVGINIYIAAIKNYTKLGIIKRKNADKESLGIVKSLSIRTPSIYQKVVNLSGGNQQKLLIGRWLLTEPDILIIDEPTRGIDVGAKVEIYKLLVDLARRGKSIIMISSEMPEILAMSDRILVINSGKASALLNTSETNQEEVMKYCTMKI